MTPKTTLIEKYKPGDSITIHNLQPYRRYFLISFIYNPGEHISDGNFQIDAEKLPCYDTLKSLSYRALICEGMNNIDIDHIIISGIYEFDNKEEYYRFYSNKYKQKPCK